MLSSLILTLVSSIVGASDVDGNTGQLLWVLSPSKVEMSPCQDVWLQTQTSSAHISRQHGCEISMGQKSGSSASKHKPLLLGLKEQFPLAVSS